MTKTNRRSFLEGTLAAAALAATGRLEAKDALPPAKFRFGLVTYLWGQDWDLPTLIKNCETTGFLAVELRTQHKHGVEAKLNAAQRAEVKKRFADSPVECIGPGCNWQFHEADPKKFKANVEGAKAYLQLSADIGASGVKVKPNSTVKGEPLEKTVARIASGLNEVGKFASSLGQEVRVEVHGRGTSNLPVMKAIFDQVTEKCVGVCWNCNGEDLAGKGLEYNFNLVKDRFGTTAHVRELNSNYPYQDLINLYRRMGWKGWMLLEARGKVKDRIAALKEQKALFDKMTTA